jgi:PPP family 3-phenylpropionic acid transporter
MSRRARRGPGRAGPKPRAARIANAPARRGGRPGAEVHAPVPAERLASFYFAYFVILGTFLPYWPLYLQGAGYGPAEIGWLMAIAPATKVISPSLGGWLADRGAGPLGLIRWAAFLTLVAFAGVLLPGGLGRLAAVMLLFSFFWNGIMPLFESLTLEHLHRDTARYGRLRMWGSVGFIGAVWSVGGALDGGLTLNDLPPLLVLLFALQWLISLAVPPARPVPHAGATGSLRDILRQGGVIGLLAASFLHQLAHGPYYSFFSIYLQNNGYGREATGQLWALGVVAEILLFLAVHRIVHRTGLRALFLGSLALSAVRWLLIAYGVRHLALVLLAQLLHAASFGAVHAASIHLIHRYFRGPHHAKGQALYSSLSFGLGGAAGSLLGGLYWERLGPEAVFTAAAGVSVLALLAAWPAVGRAGRI